jgi:hypothetical protein
LARLVRRAIRVFQVLPVRRDRQVPLGNKVALESPVRLASAPLVLRVCRVARDSPDRSAQPDPALDRKAAPALLAQQAQLARQVNKAHLV